MLAYEPAILLSCLALAYELAILFSGIVFANGLFKLLPTLVELSNFQAPLVCICLSNSILVLSGIKSSFNKLSLIA